MSAVKKSVYDVDRMTFMTGRNMNKKIIIPSIINNINITGIEWFFMISPYLKTNNYVRLILKAIV